MTDIVLKPAGVGDLAVIVQLEQAAFGEDAWTASMLDAELSGPARRYLLAVASDGRALGYGGVFLGVDTAEIMTIGTDPAARGQGVGKALMAGLIDLARAHGAKAVMLEVEVGNQVAGGLYRALGFKRTRVRRNYYGPGRDAEELRLEL